VRPIVPIFAQNILRGLAGEGMTFVTHLFAIVAVLLVVPLYIAARKQSRLPPGPQWWPLIGNALDMPREKEWLVFTEWEKTYGRREAHLPFN
jgi:hypothetical protein